MNKSSKPKLDVIIPVYNPPIMLLKKCIKSVLLSSFSNFKIICVNTSTNTDINEYLNKISRKVTDRFNLYNYKNVGASRSRNIGLTLSKAEYVTFIDADDEIKVSFFEDAFRYLDRDRSLELIIGLTEEPNREENNVMFTKPIQVNRKKEKEDLLAYLVAGKPVNNFDFSGFLVGRVYPKIFKASLLKKIKFDESISVHEDNLHSFKVFECSKKMLLVPHIWYKYNFNQSSITQNPTANGLKMSAFLENEIEFSRKMIELCSKYEISSIRKALDLRLTNQVITCCELRGGKPLQLVEKLSKSDMYLSIGYHSDARKIKDISKRQLLLLSSGKFSRKLILLGLILKGYLR